MEIISTGSASQGFCQDEVKLDSVQPEYDQAAVKLEELHDQRDTAVKKPKPCTPSRDAAACFRRSKSLALFENQQARIRNGQERKADRAQCAARYADEFASHR